MKRAAAYALFCLVASVLTFSFPGRAEIKDRNLTLGLGLSFSLGASIPQGDLWEVKPRANLGFPLSAGLRLMRGPSGAAPTILFVPYNIDTEKSGGRNGSLLSVLAGLQVFPYTYRFVQPYFMLAAGWSWIGYEGPNPVLQHKNQSGTGRGVGFLVGAGVDFQLYKWVSMGPTFFWNPILWYDCAKDIDLVENEVCLPTEDLWRVSFWFVGLRLSFNFDWEMKGRAAKPQP